MTEKNSIKKEYIMITVGVAMAASGIYFFMIPGKIVIGSVTGIAMVLSELFPVPVSVFTFLLNGMCLLIGFVLIGKEFGTKTVYASLLLPVILYMFERLVPQNGTLTNNTAMDLACFVILASAGQAVIFNSNASSGGLDIIAKVMNKYFHMELGRAIILIGMLTVLSAAFVYDTKTVVAGALGTYFNGLIVDEYISGFSRKKKVCIITESHEELKKYVMQELRRGVTLYPVKGGFEDQLRQEVVTIVNKNEYMRLMDYLRSSDEKVFVTVSTVSEVIGMRNK